MRHLPLLLLVLTIVSACSTPFSRPADATPAPDASAATAEPTQGQVTISYATWESERAVYEPLAKQFMAEHPQIRVVLVPLEELTSAPAGPSNQPESPLATLRRVVSGADTAPATFLPPEALSSNLLLNLQPLMDADATFQRADFYPGALERYTINGGTWVLPRYFYIQLLSYNKDLFKQASLPLPKPGWSWDDLLATAEHLARKNGRSVETYGFFEPSSGMLPAIGLLQTHDINLLQIPASQLQLDRPEIVAMVERIRALHESGALFRFNFKGDVGAPSEDPQQLIRDGRIGMWDSTTIPPVIFNRDGTQETVTYAFGVGTVPYPPLSGAFDSLVGEGYLISSGTAHPHEAWQWIEFLSRQPLAQPGPAGGPGFVGPGRMPARAALAAQTGFWKGMDEETAAAYRWALEHQPKLLARTPAYTVFGPLSEAMASVLDDPRADVQKALADAQKRLEEQLAQAQLTPTPEPDTSPVVVATPAVQEAPEGATVVTFGVSSDMAPQMRRLARRFSDQRPDLFVQIKSTDPTTRPLELKHVAQTSDCFAWWGPPQGDADFQALLDLQPLLDADATFPKGDIPAGLLAPYQRSGGLFGLPYAYSVRTLGFNRTAFDAAGIKPPTHRWSRTDFLAAAQALTRGEGDQKQYGFVSLDPTGADLFFFIGQFGAALTTGSGEDVRPNFDDPKVVEAIQWFLDLSTVHKVMPPLQLSYRRDDNQAPADKPAPIDTAQDPYQLVQSGRAAMWFDYGAGMFEGASPQDLAFEVGSAPLPVGNSGLRSSDFSVRGFHISAQARQPQACWEWVKFLSTNIDDLRGEIPARVSVAQSQAFADRASPRLVELAKAYAEALAQPGDAGAGSNGFGRMDLYWFMQALDDAANGRAGLAQGLAAAQQTTTAFLDCLARFGEYRPATCAKEVDPEYQGYNTEDPPVEPGTFVPRG